MRFTSLFIGGVLAVSLAACAKQNTPEFAMRNAHGLTAEHEEIHSQAQTLTKMTKDIVRKSTLNGAAIGAMAGCGLALVAATNAKNCLSGVAVGATAGAVIGHENGKKQIAHRINLVSPSALVKSIRTSSDQVAQIEMTLPSVLAAQDIALSDLTERMKRGEITEDVFAANADQIRKDRGELVQALALSEAQARSAHENLKAAASQGQTGLDWHINATQHLADDVVSARSSINLL